MAIKMERDNNNNNCVQVTKLSNGIAVASLENCSPVCQVAVIYNAGPRYEPIDKLGLTHCLRVASNLVSFTHRDTDAKLAHFIQCHLTILNSSALQPRKWQLTGNDCSTAAQYMLADRYRSEIQTSLGDDVILLDPQSYDTINAYV